MRIRPETNVDGYKIGHRQQYPVGTTLVAANLTPRKSYRKKPVDQVIFFGLQYFVKEFLIKKWNEEFFQQPKEKVLARFNRRIRNYLGPNNVGDTHISDLHDLGYLPIQILALKEGSLVPYKVAPMLYFSTDDRFFWLPTYLETIASVTIWPMCTAATTSKQFRDLAERYAMETVGDIGFVKYSQHNFSYRGCQGHEAAVLIDAGHLTSSVGSDTIPGIDFMEEYYNADSDKELVSCSVNATEHAVVCAYGQGDEFEGFRRIIQDVYPNGIVSMVSDSFDYWQAITQFTVRLKDIILAREGKVVFRPDSGDNVKIIVGDPDAPVGSPEYKGTIQCLWDIFGGTTTAKGYKLLDSHVGAILGDGVTLDVEERICEGLKAKGFASINMVYGIGSFTYQYGVSRDTDGYAIKSTFCIVNGENRNIFKDPKTDKGGLKKSAKGLIAVYLGADGRYFQKDEVTWAEVFNCAYEPVFHNGALLRNQTLNDIRLRINPNF
jgi:nicotinamide phosphoribosyltransferase